MIAENALQSFAMNPVELYENPQLVHKYKLSANAMRLLKTRKFQQELSAVIAKAEPIDITVWKNYVEFEYKPKSYFDKRSFRYFRAGQRGTLINFGCKKGCWDASATHITRAGRAVQGECRCSMEVHHVLVPIDRVENLAAMWGVSMRKKAKSKRAAANPLLLSISPNGYARNDYLTPGAFVQNPMARNEYFNLPAANADKKIKWKVEITKSQPWLVEPPRFVFFASKKAAQDEARTYRRAGYHAKVKALSLVEQRAIAHRGLQNDPYTQNPFVTREDVGNNPFVTREDVGNNPFVTREDVGNNPFVTFDDVGNNPKRKRRKVRKIKSNPQLQPAPFPKGKKIPIAKFEKWLYANASPEEISRYDHQKEQFKAAHMGSEPRFITRDILNVGIERAVTDRDFIISMGKAPADLYSVPEWSGKAKQSRNWQHDWKTRPDVGITADGKARISLLKGSARVSGGWMHG